jgi:alkylhydroperoxidase family enzyme
VGRARGLHVPRAAQAVTLIAAAHVPDVIYQEVRPHFNDRELCDLTLAVATINAWNRLSIAARLPAGSYQPASVTAPVPR